MMKLLKWPPRAFDLRLTHWVVRCGVCLCFHIDYMTSDAPKRIAEDGAKALLVPMAAACTGVLELLPDCVAKNDNLFVLLSVWGQLTV